MNLLIFRTRRIGEKIEEKAVYQFLTDQELERIQKVGNIFNLVFFSSISSLTTMKQRIFILKFS